MMFLDMWLLSLPTDLQSHKNIKYTFHYLKKNKLDGNLKQKELIKILIIALISCMIRTLKIFFAPF